MDSPPRRLTPSKSGRQSPEGGRSIASSHVRNLVAAIVSCYTVPLPPGAELLGIVEQYYAPCGTFTDPLVSVTTPSLVAAQFSALSLLLRRCTVELHSYRVMGGGEGISLDSTMNFALRFLPDLFALRVRVSTEILLDPQGQVLHHTDHWSVASLLESVPLLSTLYHVFRWAFGLVTSYLMILSAPERAKAR